MTPKNRSMRKIVNPLQLLIDRVKSGGKVPPEIQEHVFEVLRRVNIGAQFGFEFETYAALAAKFHAYVEWVKSMSALCGIDPKHEDYTFHTQNALRWRTAYLSAHVPAPKLDKLTALHKKKDKQWRRRHKDDPNAPINAPQATIPRGEESNQFPEAPKRPGGRGGGWERPPSDLSDDQTPSSEE